MQRHRFAVHLDVRHYFPSVDLEILRRLLARRVRDRRFLAVVDAVLDSGALLYGRPRVRAWAGLRPGWRSCREEGAARREEGKHGKIASGSGAPGLGSRRASSGPRRATSRDAGSCSCSPRRPRPVPASAAAADKRGRDQVDRVALVRPPLGLRRLEHPRSEGHQILQRRLHVLRAGCTSRE